MPWPTAGIGILLVEHDMALVRQVCDHIYVLDFGELIFEGSAAEMLASPVVRSALSRLRGGDDRVRAGQYRTASVGSAAVLEIDGRTPATARPWSCGT